MAHTGAELWAASKFIGRECATANKDFFLCKKNAGDAPTACEASSVLASLCANRTIEALKTEFGSEYVAFQKCLDKTEAVPYTVMSEVLRRELGGRPISEVFEYVDPTPLASASVAQVHFATLHDGREVAVKILRPGIELVIRKDVSLLDAGASLMELLWADGKRQLNQQRKSELADELVAVIAERYLLSARAHEARSVPA